MQERGTHVTSKRECAHVMLILIVVIPPPSTSSWENRPAPEVGRFLSKGFTIHNYCKHTMYVEAERMKCFLSFMLLFCLFIWKLIKQNFFYGFARDSSFEFSFFYNVKNPRINEQLSSEKLRLMVLRRDCSHMIQFLKKKAAPCQPWPCCTNWLKWGYKEEEQENLTRVKQQKSS